MTETAKLRCRNCGHRFEAEVLSDEERENAARDRRHTSAVGCPECRRTDVRRGWD